MSVLNEHLRTALLARDFDEVGDILDEVSADFNDIDQDGGDVDAAELLFDLAVFFHGEAMDERKAGGAS